MSAGALTEAAAHDYADRGLSVLALRGKRPHPQLAPRAWLSATVDHNRIRAWWRHAPTANVGIVPRALGAIALDVDPRHGGDETLHALEQELGHLPDTPRQLTGSGGLHVILRRPRGQLVASLGPGVEVKDRHYVAAAPSVHPDTGRRYQWEIGLDEMAIAEASAAWARALQRPRDTPSRMPERVAAGGRNIALTREAGRLRRHGYSEREIAESLLTLNRGRCMPPLPDREVIKIAHSIAAHDVGPPWLPDPLRFSARDGLPPTARHLLFVLASRAKDDGTVRGGDWLRDVMGVSPSTLKRATREVEAIGLNVTRRTGAANVFDLSSLAPIASPHPNSGGTAGVILTPVDPSANDQLSVATNHRRL